MKPLREVLRVLGQGVNVKTNSYEALVRLGGVSAFVLSGVGCGIGITTLSAKAVEEMPAEIIAVQVRDQGYVCDKALSAERDQKFSKPGEDAWILKCENATYRVRLVADMTAVVEPLSKANESYTGTWGTGPAQCVLGQEEEDAPLIMTATGYDQHKVHCTFKSVTAKAGTTAGSPQSWHVSAECARGGGNEPYDFTLLLQDNTLTFHDNIGDRVLQRCPK